MKVQPQGVSDEELIHLFWNGLPEAERPFEGYLAPWADIHNFISSVLYEVKGDEPEPTPMVVDMEEPKDEEEEEDPEDFIYMIVMIESVLLSI